MGIIKNERHCRTVNSGINYPIHRFCREGPQQMSNMFLRMPKQNPVHLLHGVTIAHNSTWVEIKKSRWGKKNKAQMRYETRGLEALAAHYKSNQQAFNFAMDAIVDWEFYITLYCTTPNGIQYNRYLPVFREKTSFKLMAGFIESSVIPLVKTKDCVEYGYYGITDSPR